jgi:putative ABC transport system permease protein
MFIDYILYALKGLKERKLRSWLTMLGIFIGIASVVALIGLGEGLRGAIVGQFGFIGPDVLAVQASGINFAGPPGQAVARPLTDDLTNKIQRVYGVEAAINRYIESGTLEFNDRQDIVFAWNVPTGKDRKVFEDMLNLAVDKGRLLKDGDKFKVVIGNDFSKDDRFGKGMRVGSNIIFNDLEFEIIGIMNKKGSFIFDTSIIMNEDVLIDNFREDDSVNAIAVKVKDITDIDNVKSNLEELLRKERNVGKGEEDFSVESPESTLATLNDILFGVQLFISIIAFISIIVGSIGITNTMYTSVLERTKEIGIMKSIGAKNSTIFKIFLIESGFLGFIGGIIGVIIGIILAYSFAFLGRISLGSDLIKADISISIILFSILFSTIVGLIAGSIPAIQASRKNPVDSLRFTK